MSIETGVVELTDPAAMRALSHPARIGILERLQQGPATATECAGTVGESPSSCSYHLRTLARFGFVERARASDGRERRWRLKVVRFRTRDGAGAAPDEVAASRLLRRRNLERADSIVEAYLAAESSYPQEWQDASTFSTGILYLTRAETESLRARLDEILDPYVERDDPASRPADVIRVLVATRIVPMELPEAP